MGRDMLDPSLIFQVLLLLGVANATPIFAKKLLKDRFSAPLDGGMKLPDGQPLFGASKTIRGLVLSISLTAVTAVLIGFDWMTGAGLAAGSMGGDLISSFVKRRLGLRLHSQALGLDQIPEALLPMLLLQARLELSAADIAVVLAAFIVLELGLSRILFRLHIRDRPY
jgi:CDP-diglyceride synthetase